MAFCAPSPPPHQVLPALRDTGTPPTPTSTHSRISAHAFSDVGQQQPNNHAALPCPHIPRMPSATQRTALSSSVLLGVLGVPCELSPFPLCPCSLGPTYTCFLLSSWGPLASQSSRVLFCLPILHEGELISPNTPSIKGLRPSRSKGFCTGLQSYRTTAFWNSPLPDSS